MKKQAGSPVGEAGQTLLEILLALGVSVLVLSAAVLGVTTSLSNTQYTKNQGLANSYAQEGMAVVRKIRDSSLHDFASLGLITNTTYCLGPSPMGLEELTLPAKNCKEQSVVPENGIFSREVKFEHNSDSCATNCPGATCIKGSKVTVKVSWSDNKCPVGTPLCHKVELITCFSSIDQKLAP
jgi:hypothetical protein